MEVKIDADELCELRKNAKKSFQSYINDLIPVYYGVDYSKDYVSKLKEERDFWRAEALSTARTFEDMALKGISGQILVSIPMKDRARCHGYGLE